MELLYIILIQAGLYLGSYGIVTITDTITRQRGTNDAEVQ